MYAVRNGIPVTADDIHEITPGSTWTVSGARAVGVTMNDLVVTGAAEHVPQAPSVTPAVLSNSSIRVTWASTNDGGRPITSYDLWYRVVSTVAWTQFNDETGTSRVITVQPGTNYEIHVRATTSLGDSDWGTATVRSTGSSLNTGPTVASITRSPSAVGGAGIVTLTATGTFADATSSNTTWRAAPVSEVTDVTLTVTGTDTGGLQGSDSVTVQG